MKKKFLKFALIVMLLLLLLFLASRIYVTNIMYKTYKTMFSKAEENNFYEKRTNYLENQTTILETFIKDNIYKRVYVGDFSDGTRKLTFWEHNKSPNEKNKYYLIVQVNDDIPYAEMKETDYQIEPNNKMYKYDFAKSLVVGEGNLGFYDAEKYTFKDIFFYNLKNTFGDFKTKVFLFSDKENCYKMRFSGSNIYIDKTTYLPTYAVSIENENEYTVIEHFTKDVSLQDIAEPDISNYNNMQ